MNTELRAATPRGGRDLEIINQTLKDRLRSWK